MIWIFKKKVFHTSPATTYSSSPPPSSPSSPSPLPSPPVVSEPTNLPPMPSMHSNPLACSRASCGETSSPWGLSRPSSLGRPGTSVPPFLRAIITCTRVGVRIHRFSKKNENRRWPIGTPQLRPAHRPAPLNRLAQADFLADSPLADRNGSASRSASAANRLAGRLAGTVDAVRKKLGLSL